ncbi:hypothetical protein BDV12DRAFT_205786 [Aspergillus spectabilis]
MGEKIPPLLSRREIEVLIADGAKIFILDQFVIKANPWIPYHPGGDKPILHMVGRDATDEITALHSAEAKQKMTRHRIGRIEGRWKNFAPPIQGGKFRPLADNTQVGCNDDTSNDSRGASPVFDTNRTGLRHRCGGDLSSSASVTSASSIEEDDGMAHLDTLTREKINLDLEKYPAVDHETQDAIVVKYRLLSDRIKAEGLYDCNYSAYAVEACRYSLLFACMVLTLHWGWYALSGAFLGAVWHQLAFVVHDAGHMGITHNFHIDTCIGMLVADFCGGLSVGWWKRNHNVHHIVTNSPENDPDVEYLPFLALSHQFFGNLRSTYYEHLMEYDAVAKLGVKIAGQFVFWYWYGYLLIYTSIPSNRGRFAFFMISHMIAAPLHVQLTLSHFAMSMADLGPDESFPQKMIRTTMDIDCPQWLDFFHGGLQFQVVHHLYPRIPRHNLRRTQKLVQDICDEVGIPYALYGFVDGNRKVVGALAEVSKQAAILAKCQQVMVRESVHGHAH